MPKTSGGNDDPKCNRSGNCRAWPGSLRSHAEAMWKLHGSREATRKPCRSQREGFGKVPRRRGVLFSQNAEHCGHRRQSFFKIYMCPSSTLQLMTIRRSTLPSRANSLVYCVSTRLNIDLHRNIAGFTLSKTDLHSQMAPHSTFTGELCGVFRELYEEKMTVIYRGGTVIPYQPFGNKPWSEPVLP